MKRILTLILWASFTLAQSMFAQPVVSAVLDGAAYTNNIAPGSVFVVKGTALSAVGNVGATTIPYPATLNNVRITLTAVNGGMVLSPRMIYTYNVGGVNQLAALLPSSAAVGAYDLRVENGTATSAAFRTSVVARKLGIVTASGDGKGQAQATLDGKLILQRPTNQGKFGDFETRSARPGERVDLWGTGLGADLASDNGGTSGDQTATAQVRVLVDGLEVVPLFAGRSNGYPGLDQIVFTLPNSTALNCTIMVELRVGTLLSNPVTMATSRTDACPADTTIRINEVESNGGTPGDWVELFNPGPGPQALGGFVFKDNDDTRNHVLPALTVPAGGYYMLEEAAFGFGLGAADQARLYRPDGTLAASYTWSAHAAVTYGRCPNGTGPLSSNSTSTKAAANDCGIPVRINEVESEGGSPGDWVELYNPTTTPLDLSGFMLRDSVDTNAYSLPAGSIIAPQGYLVLEAAAFTFDLGASDSVRLFDAAGTLTDSYSWTAHATSTFGRCPNGSGDFSTTTSPTKGAVNACAGDVSFAPWPGAATVENAGPVGVFNGNLSGLIYEPSGGPTPGVIWAARNGPGSLFRLTFNGTIWTPDTANSWATGKQLRYPNGSGDPDAEGVTLAGNSSNGGLFVSTERDNSVSGVSRLSILRFDPAATGAVLTATHEWNLTADLPAAGPNLGLEAITWVPDSYLTSRNFFDESKNRTYNPADYPNHGSGIFFVGVEASGIVYAYALDQAGTNFTRLATIPTGLAGVMDLQFDRDQNDLWAVCDDTCQGRSVVFRIDSTGKFTAARRFERPTGMPNLNNEGFAIAPAALCTANGKPVFWADDGETGGHAIRRGTLNCSPL
jgi:uncharacterized protein (TIGR03437 family)